MLGATAQILVVDDENLNRVLLSTALQLAGYGVATAENGAEALEAMADGLPDLVLLDIMMPVLDGYKVLERLKGDERRRHIPVIVISAEDDLQSVVRCIEMGAEDHLPKPFDPVLLRARISACLEKKRLRDREVELYDELQANYRRLQELEQLRDDLTHMIVHDLRTPLTSLTTGLQTLQMMAELDPDCTEILGISIQGGQMLLGMINDLLDVSKMEDGSLGLTCAELSAADVIADAVQQVAPLAELSGQRLEAGVEPGLPPLVADEDKLRRALVNLLGNALKFTPNGGTITVSARREAEGIAFAVQDTGEGIPPECFERIFEKFGQVESRQAGRAREHLHVRASARARGGGGALLGPSRPPPGPIHPGLQLRLVAEVRVQLHRVPPGLPRRAAEAGAGPRQRQLHPYLRVARELRRGRGEVMLRQRKLRAALQQQPAQLEVVVRVVGVQLHGTADHLDGQPPPAEPAEDHRGDVADLGRRLVGRHLHGDRRQRLRVQAEPVALPRQRHPQSHIVRRGVEGLALGSDLLQRPSVVVGLRQPAPVAAARALLQDPPGLAREHRQRPAADPLARIERAQQLAPAAAFALAVEGHFAAPAEPADQAALHADRGVAGSVGGGGRRRRHGSVRRQPVGHLDRRRHVLQHGLLRQHGGLRLVAALGVDVLERQVADVVVGVAGDHRGAQRRLGQHLPAGLHQALAGRRDEAERAQPQRLHLRDQPPVRRQPALLRHGEVGVLLPGHRDVNARGAQRLTGLGGLAAEQ
ncbi:MAG: response regulator [Armatimonadetes bacterium]|nr:response regulator [Armatimonadota bacterium]